MTEKSLKDWDYSNVLRYKRELKLKRILGDEKKN